MDPISAVGVASAALSFASFADRFLSGAVAIYKSSNGCEKEIEDAASHVQHMHGIIQKIQGPHKTNSNFSVETCVQEKLWDLVKECTHLHTKFQDLVGQTRLTGKERLRFIASIRVKWRSATTKQELARLSLRLTQLQTNINTCLLILLSSQTNTLAAAVEKLLARTTLEVPATQGISENTATRLELLAMDLKRERLVPLIQEVAHIEDQKARQNGVDSIPKDSSKWILCNEDSEDSEDSEDDDDDDDDGSDDSHGSYDIDDSDDSHGIDDSDDSHGSYDIDDSDDSD